MMGLAGHGMLIAPVLPCRVARLEDLLVIGRGYQGPLLTELIIRGGKAPASEPPAEVEPDTYALGPDGPTLTLDGVALADMVLQIDVGVGSGEWTCSRRGSGSRCRRRWRSTRPRRRASCPSSITR